MGVTVTVKQKLKPLEALTMRNTTGRIKAIKTGVNTGVKVTVTVKQKLKALVSWPFEVIGGFKHCF